MRMSGAGNCSGSGVTWPVPRVCCTMLHEPSFGKITLPRAATAKTVSLPFAPNELFTSTRCKRIFCPFLPMSITQSSGAPIGVG